MTPREKDELQGIDERRGIKNTTARFEDVTQRRTIQSNLQEDRPREQTPKEEAPGTYDTPPQTNSRRKARGFALNALRQFALEEKLDVQDDELLATQPKKVELAPFPYGIFFLAFIKDVLDAVFTISIFGFIVAVALTPMIAFVLFYWVMGKMNGGWWKKRLIGWMWVRLLIVIGFEILPFFQIIPATTIFVLMVHFRETKLGKAFNAVLERVHTHRIPPK